MSCSPDERVSAKSGGGCQSDTIHPGFRFAHPGYAYFCDVIYAQKTSMTSVRSRRAITIGITGTRRYAAARDDEETAANTVIYD